MKMEHSVIRHGRYAFMALLALLVSATSAQAAERVSVEDAKRIAEEAYIYGYPLVTMEMTRRVMTNVPKVEATRGPMGHLVRIRSYPSAEYKDVTAPNADTLYTTAWIDVKEEPWILSLPDVQDRYYLFPMLDGWTDVFEVPGTRTTGTGAQVYAITGPGWEGALPEGVVEYKSPTSMVWFIGRIYCTGTPEDYAAVHEIQDEISLVPLSAYGKPFTAPPGKVDPNVDMKTPVREQVNALDTAAYFTLLASLMKDNPPAEGDASIIAKMAKLGIVPGKPFAFGKLNPNVQTALKDVPKDSLVKIMGHFKESGKNINGWTFTTNTGLYGTDYLQRAVITAIGLGANRPQDAVYPTSELDLEGKPYTGESKYVMHFEKGQLPPVNGFWSLTMYNDDYFFVDNPLDRYTLSARNDLKKNADGSVDLYLQHDNPGSERESNWLPAPKGRFIPMLRLYWPSEGAPSILDGTWEIPVIKKVQ
ncbi:hypothetical protein Q670_05870 [Alcanivorax sp. P2S70]|uniref:DUF1254 domain-containing protein n=1 Tax=Alcanivorax sp. P2S70 TaxID=1397527 RepID=UPI0003B6AD22|nr:DUF1254 domain-containing protein [Alcanivorax sp. P2S70]ERP86695.1 hypothetical protein Q670_05870 [Alcanivorax sp. P2S70]